MKRIISGVIVASIITFVILYLPKITLNVIVTLIALFATYELTKAITQIGYFPIKFFCYISCFFLLPVGIIEEYFLNIGALILIIAILIYGFIIKKEKKDMNHIWATFFPILYIPFLLSHVVKAYYITKLNMDIGRYVIWYMLFGAAITDMFAHMIGSRFGKHKLSPYLSPNKTIEGAIGGIIGNVIIYLCYTYILNCYFDFSLNYIIIGLIGVFISGIAQMGDLVASGIKRMTKIKDFGNIMPGHGGVLDRIDSILFVAPFIYYLFVL